MLADLWHVLQAAWAACVCVWHVIDLGGGRKQKAQQQITQRKGMRVTLREVLGKKIVAACQKGGLIVERNDQEVLK